MNEAIVSHDGPGHRWLASLGRRGMELGLQRIRALLARLGDPQRDLPIIAVAGTDGKGSTSAMIAALLRAGGLRTAHYTSPHLVETRERIDLPDGLASAAGLDDALVQVYAACGADLDPTPFEALTAAALVLIRQADSEVAVLEVGLGGRLDAVNATEPVVSVITQLGYDHMAILGDTLPQIAWEKAGIARESRPLVCAQPGLVKPALRRHGIQPRLLSLGRDLSVAEASWSASRAHGDVVAALASVDWPLRAEVLQASPLLLADAAHNPSGMKALAAMLGEHGRGWQVMLAVRKDRDAAELIRTLAPWTACFWLPRCAGETLRAADELAAVVDQVAPACLAAVGSAGRCLQQALREADRGPGVVVTGSQHALGEWLQSKILHSPRLERRLAGNGRRV
jgi:dihydrofolate synthase/folylpolyglutamate synthase